MAAEIAQAQHGYVLTSQMTQQGASHIEILRATRSGMLVAHGHGVYHMHGAPAHPQESIWVYYLRLSLAGKAPRASRRSAAAVLGLGSLVPDTPQFDVEAANTVDWEGVALYPKGPDTPIEVNGIECSSIPRLVLDLVADYEDLGHVGEVVADALRRGMVSRPELEHALAPWAKRFALAANDGVGAVLYLLNQAGWDN